MEKIQWFFILLGFCGLLLLWLLFDSLFNRKKEDGCKGYENSCQCDKCVETFKNNIF